jgi:uncharacterized protein
MERRVEFKSGEETLRGSLFIPEGKGPFASVIFFHGSGGNGEMHFELAKKVSEKGILGFAFNYRGCGKSDGKFEEQTLEMGMVDGRAAVEFLLSQKEADRSRLGFSGGSFGGFLASLFSAEYNPKSLVLIAPAAYSPEVYITQRDSDDDFKKDFEESVAYKKLAEFTGNLLIVECEFDDVLPKGMVEKYLEVAGSTSKKEYFLLREAKHRISINPEAREILENKITNWFLGTL